jgi:sulfite reductase (NADPH) hemoprotein beta-component
VIGPSFSAQEVPDVIEKLIVRYLELRDSDAERFVDTVWRTGIEPFKEAVYGAHHQAPENRKAA